MVLIFSSFFFLQIIEKNDKLDNILNDIGTPILPSSVKDDIAVELNLRFDKVPGINSLLHSVSRYYSQIIKETVFMI